MNTIEKIKQLELNQTQEDALNNIFGEIYNLLLCKPLSTPIGKTEAENFKNVDNVVSYNEKSLRIIRDNLMKLNSQNLRKAIKLYTHDLPAFAELAKQYDKDVILEQEYSIGQTKALDDILDTLEAKMKERSKNSR